MVTVVAALIQTETGYLMGLRPPHKARGLTWEFVGGKVEAGVTPQQALQRKCQEELGVQVEVGPLFMESNHTYPDLSIHFQLYHATITSGQMQPLEHVELRYVPKSQLPDYITAPEDAEILHRLLQITE